MLLIVFMLIECKVIHAYDRKVVHYPHPSMVTHSGEYESSELNKNDSTIACNKNIQRIYKQSKGSTMVYIHL